MANLRVSLVRGISRNSRHSLERGYDRAVKLRIDPEPDEAEREAIEAAIGTAEAPAGDAWRAAALAEGVEESGEPEPPGL